MVAVPPQVGCCGIIDALGDAKSKRVNLNRLRCGCASQHTADDICSCPVVTGEQTLVTNW